MLFPAAGTLSLLCDTTDERQPDCLMDRTGKGNEGMTPMLERTAKDSVVGIQN